MEIQTPRLTRTFYNHSHQFYTLSVLNHHRQTIIENGSKNEFIVYYSDQTVVPSSDFYADVIVHSQEEIRVMFEKDGTVIEVNYIPTNQVLKKQLTIVQSSKSIHAVDCEVWDFVDEQDVYFPKKQADIEEMAGFSGYYVELGQPIYAKGLFFGMEFPMGENRMDGTRFFSRYYIGSSITKKRVIWPTVVGVAKNSSKEAIQEAFFEYISSIAQPSGFRKQYNSWFDYMTDIDEGKIVQSFEEISHGFEDYGVHLDAYVVDDGWPNYESVWEFNEKFPQELAPIQQKVRQLDSTLGLWIGPRGGYGGTQKKMSDWLEAHPELQVGSKNHLSEDVNVADFNYLRKLREKMLEYQAKYDISYWKIDGWLLRPEKMDGSGSYSMYIMTQVYEFLIQLLMDLRKERGERDCFINLTSYVNPSPWFLQWVNSLWIQTSQDVGFTPNAGSDMARMLTYRDGQYAEFLRERDLQLPLWSLYNHEPIFASTAHRGYMDHVMQASDVELEQYLFFIGTRGNAFWEFYYSYELFDDAKWKANAKAITWIEQHYDTLRHAQLFGTKASEMQGIYGYDCWNKETGERIISFRNPCATQQRMDKALEGFAPQSWSKIQGEESQVQEKEDTLVVTLEPYAILIVQSQ